MGGCTTRQGVCTLLEGIPPYGVFTSIWGFTPRWGYTPIWGYTPYGGIPTYGGIPPICVGGSRIPPYGGIHPCGVYTHIGRVYPHMGACTTHKRGMHPHGGVYPHMGCLPPYGGLPHMGGIPPPHVDIYIYMFVFFAAAQEQNYNNTTKNNMFTGTFQAGPSGNFVWPLPGPLRGNPHNGGRPP